MPSLFKRRVKKYKHGQEKVVRELILWPKKLPDQDGVEQWRAVGIERIEYEYFIHMLAGHVYREGWKAMRWVDGRTRRKKK
jgi:hypothetical protein